MSGRDPYRALASQLRESFRHTSERNGMLPLHLTHAEWSLVIDALDRAAKPYSRGKSSEARIRELRRIERRDWLAGEPRLGWIHAGTAKAMLRDGLIAIREGSEGGRHRSPIVDLTDAGRFALAQHAKGEGGDGG